MIDEKLTPNFWLSELVQSETAERAGLDNSPTPEALQNLRGITAPGIQRVRNLLGCAVLVSSGYRNPEVNRLVGSSNPNRAHTKGLAVDFRAPSYGTPLKVAQRILEHASEIRFDQLIHEGSWIHISFHPTAPRGQVQTAHFKNGKASYTPGLA